MRTFLFAAVVAAALALPATAAAAPLPPSADFDGDGHADLALGAPMDSVHRHDAAGAVNVLYGAAGGLTADRDEQFTEATAGVPGTPERGDRFGASLAAGDFDGDGYADLAVGAPGEGTTAGIRSGLVVILHGSPSGLIARGEPGWTQGRVGVKGTPEAEDGFGLVLAAGDFDGDRRDDLAIGTPLDSVSGHRAAGAVNVLYGSPSGLTASGDDLWTLDTPGIKGIAAANSRFGWALAAGELSGNGRDDLAIGIPGGRISGHDAAGAVTVLYGRAGGLSTVDDLWSQDAQGIAGFAAAGDQFGSALAIADFDGDGIGDLAVGVPFADVRGALDAGAVNVLYGSGAGLRAPGNQRWTRAGLRGGVAAGDRFGSALAAADFSRNTAADLAVGAPGDDAGAKQHAGAVNVLYGDAGGGLRAGFNQRWTQDSAGIKGHAEAGDEFGSALAIGDFDADGAFDLVIGTPRDSVAGHSLAGAANVIAGSGQGLHAADNELWTQGTTGVLGAVGRDAFASALASG